MLLPADSDEKEVKWIVRIVVQEAPEFDQIASKDKHCVWAYHRFINSGRKLSAKAVLSSLICSAKLCTVKGSWAKIFTFQGGTKT